MKGKNSVKKCCLISLIKSENYGANLQGYALYHFIKEHFPTLELVVIDLLRPGQKGYMSRSRSKESFLNRMRQSISTFVFNVRSLRSYKLRRSRFENFTGNMNFSKCYHNTDELYADYPICDIYITGSDQVWCPTREFDLKPYLLTFAKHPCVKISYAPSMSTLSLTQEDAVFFKDELNTFNHVSVREFSDKELLSAVIPSKNISVVVDPVVLMPPIFWQSMCTPVSKENYLLYYTIGHNEDLLAYAKMYCRAHGLQLLYFRPTLNSALYSREYYSINDAGPAELLSWINSANVVITDSYHGILMSLLLETPFLFHAAQYTSRFDTICKSFDLYSHKISDLSTLDGSQNPNVSKHTRELIEQASNISQDYLLNAIKSSIEINL